MKPKESPLIGKNPEKKKYGRMDLPFLVAVLLLLSVGLLALASASYARALSKTGDSYFYTVKQLKFAIFGLGCMLVVSLIPYSFYTKRFLKVPLVIWGNIVAIALLILVLIIGVGGESYDEKRWISVFGLFTFQPSEVAKLMMIILLSWYISLYREKMKKFSWGILLPGLFIFMYAAIIAIEPHLSAAILVAVIGLSMIVIGGCRIWQIAVIGVPLIILALILIDKVPYMALRIEYWQHPENDPRGSGYQILQSLYAIGSGGLTGLGFGKSRQKYLYLPEVQNDFIFSVWAEEMGFFGVVLVVLLFAFLIYRGLYIASKARDTFSSLLVTGIIARVAVQVILNLAVVTNFIPTTGISLPFFSSGGTSLIMLLIEMGIVLQVSRSALIEK